MRVAEQAQLAALPTRFEVQDEKVHELERRIEYLERMVKALNDRQSKPIDGRTLRWQR